MKVKDLTEEFRNGNILKLVIKLVVPAVVAQLITFLYNIVDRIFVSNIAEIKTEALAALGIVLPITIIVQSFSSLIGLGGSPKASMKLGESKEEEANNIFNNCASALFIVGIILTIILFIFAKELVTLFGCPLNAIEYATNYLKIYSIGTIAIILVQGLNPFISSLGHSFIAMGTTLIGAIMNIILDPIFIFVFDMKVEGAALATIISQYISLIWLISFFFLKGNQYFFKFKLMKFKKDIILGVLFLGLSPFIMMFTESLIQIVFNVCLKMSTGGESSSYTAALTIMLSALQLISLPLNGLGFGVAPFVSFNYGSGDSYRLKKGIKYTFIIALIFAILIYVPSMSFPSIYAYIFNSSDEVKILLDKYLPLFIMGSIFFCVQMTLQNINVALGQGLSAIILATSRKIIILIPLCFLLNHFLGYQGVYLSEGLADIIAGIITSIVIFTTFPKVIKKRELKVKNNINK